MLNFSKFLFWLKLIFKGKETIWCLGVEPKKYYGNYYILIK